MVHKEKGESKKSKKLSTWFMDSHIVKFQTNGIVAYKRSYLSIIFSYNFHFRFYFPFQLKVEVEIFSKKNSLFIKRISVEISVGINVEIVNK